MINGELAKKQVPLFSGLCSNQIERRQWRSGAYLKSKYRRGGFRYDPDKNA